MKMLLLLVFVLMSGFLFVYPSLVGVHNEFGFSFYHHLSLSKQTLFDIRKTVTSISVHLVNTLNYLKQNCFRVFLLWALSFGLWVLSCCSWVLNAQFSYTVSVYLSLLFCVLALFVLSLRAKPDSLSC